ncbi:MAG: hypothetical protein ROZ64_18040 [Burkholderiaceae bacterium]|nr:hypothetical protein [Burkholderiaceae bacterium]
MNAIGAAFLAIASVLMLALPRRLAVLPLVLSALYMTGAQLLQIGPATFTIPRLLVLVGFMRVLVRGEGITSGLQTVDKLILLWAAVLIGTSAFHTSDAWLYRSGIVWTELGCYFLFRIFMQDLDDVCATFRLTCIVMLPLAALMLLEKATGHNPFSVLGAAISNSVVREGHVRAAGPFSHPILAGTVGAACLAMAFAIRPTARWASRAGLVAGAGIVAAATSSGPILMVVFIILGIATWVLRYHMRALRWSIVAGILALAAVMKDPVYFLMARVDISGGSQGYYRSQLIRSSIQHLSEWWMAGTDYTRHWMQSGISANDRHADITNHFLAMGVMGGLPLMLVFVGMLAYSFRDVGRALNQLADAPRQDQLFVWALGALLFGFCMDFWSISLFDQSVTFFYLSLAAIQGVASQDQTQFDVGEPWERPQDMGMAPRASTVNCKAAAENP